MRCRFALNEVDKCILMCNECHGVLHAQNIAAELHLKATVAGRSAEQRLKGQMIFDRLKGLATFLTNETILVHSYRVSLGGKKPRIVFGTQLMLDDDLLGKWMRELGKHKTIVIRAWDKAELARIEHIEGTLQDVPRHPLFSVFDDPVRRRQGLADQWVGWTRKGYMQNWRIRLLGDAVW